MVLATRSSPSRRPGYCLADRDGEVSHFKASGATAFASFCAAAGLGALGPGPPFVNNACVPRQTIYNVKSQRGGGGGHEIHSQFSLLLFFIRLLSPSSLTLKHTHTHTLEFISISLQPRFRRLPSNFTLSSFAALRPPLALCPSSASFMSWKKQRVA